MLTSQKDGFPENHFCYQGDHGLAFGAKNLMEDFVTNNIPQGRLLF